MFRTNIFQAVLISILLLLAISGCKKQTPITDPEAKLNFSTDTLSFDTVFTSLGSSTRFFKVLNPHNREIEISSVNLANGSASQFRINVDGVPGISHKDIRIAERDSLYVFVEVTIDPNNDNTPFVINETIDFVTNGNLQKVVLEAYGQNAHYYNGTEICNETWVNDKPYVLLGSVLVDTACTLNINEGVRVFLHANASLFVSGTLLVNGTKDSLVTFEGDRLEHFFDDLPGQWGSINILRGSSGSVIKYAMISEGSSGVVIGSTTSSNLNDFTQANQPDVALENTIIRNSSEYGVFSFYSNVDMENCLVYATGKNNLAFLFGGTHTITHCTAANYGVIGIEHKFPVLRYSNYAVQNITDIHLRDMSIDFRNSLFYGNIPLDTSAMAGEIDIDTIVSVLPLHFEFNHCLFRSNIPMAGNGAFVNPIQNADPLFQDIGKEDYSLENGSPAKNTGNPAYLLPEDLNGNPRNGIVDIGAIRIE